MVSTHVLARVMLRYEYLVQNLKSSDVVLWPPQSSNAVAAVKCIDAVAIERVYGSTSPDSDGAACCVPDKSSAEYTR